MTAMRQKIRIIGSNHQQGVALVIAVIVLLILTVVGIYAVTTSTMETKITGFEKTYKEAFFIADSGEPIGIEVTKAIIHYVPSAIGNLPAPWNDSDVIKDENLFKVVDGNDPEIFTNGRNSDTPYSDPPDIVGDDLGFPSNVKLMVDIDRLSSYQMSGGAMEFGSGYEGIGQGGGGEIGIIYAIDSVGQTTFTNAESMIEAGYLHVVGMPGGE